MKSDKKDLSVAKATRELLEQKPFLKELMEIGAVNYRGLARHFQNKVKEKTGKETVNLDSIVIAIRRYEDNLTINESWTEKIQKVLQKSELSLKSDIVYYTLPRKPKNHKLATEVYQQIDQTSGDRIYLLQSDSEIGIVTNQKNAQQIENKIKPHQTKNTSKNLAIVIMDSPEEILEANGILSHLTQKIIQNGIGITEMFSTYTETIFLVQEKQSTQLYQTLKQLTKQERDQV